MGAKATPRKAVFAAAVAIDVAVLPDPVSVTLISVFALAAVVVAYALIAGGALSGLLAAPTVIALATIPVAAKVARGVRQNYESPYGLMPTMAANIKLHALTGLLLFAGYLVAIVAGHLMSHPPVFLR